MWQRIAFPLFEICQGGVSLKHFSPIILGHLPWKLQPISGGFSSTISSATKVGLKSGSGSRTAPSNTSVYGWDGYL